MTFPGADTMNDGIRGDDCFLFIWGIRGEGMVSMGESSGVWVPWDEVERGLRPLEEVLSGSSLS